MSDEAQREQTLDEFITQLPEGHSARRQYADIKSRQMSRLHLILLRSIEEAAEFQQRVSKAMLFGMSQRQRDQPLTNAERIMGEFHDLVAVMEMAGLHPRSLDDETIAAKKLKVERYLDAADDADALERLDPVSPRDDAVGAMLNTLSTLPRESMGHMLYLLSREHAALDGHLHGIFISEGQDCPHCSRLAHIRAEALPLITQLLSDAETIRRHRLALSVKSLTSMPPCQDCDGRGEVLDVPGRVLDGKPYWETCETCHGTGEAPTPSTSDEP